MTAVSGIGVLESPVARAGEIGPRVNDVSQLNPVTVAQVVKPRSTDDVRSAIRASSRSISVGGGRFSMGGQIAAPDSLHFDMRSLANVVAFDATRRTVRVQGGMTWRDLQDLIDPHDLSVMIMQSFSNFTVGGSVSVNCHGRYVGKGPVVNSVRAVQVVTADGEVIELSRSSDGELFSAVVGGYGGLGVITEVELDLDRNEKIERAVKDVPLDAYVDFFRATILSDPAVVLHNADLAPPDFLAPRAVTWRRSDEQLTRQERLTPRDRAYLLEKYAIWAVTETPGGSWLRGSLSDQRAMERVVAWRNHEASLDTAILEPWTRRFSTYLLQEYFVPPKYFVAFARAMSRILRLHNVSVLNVSIRHSPADTVSLMKWAPTEVFSFVLYYKQSVSDEASNATTLWTRALIDAVRASEGRYYLPYRLNATRTQFRQTYPEAREFVAIKKRVDPENRFRNLLWDRYLPVT